MAQWIKPPPVLYWRINTVPAAPFPIQFTDNIPGTVVENGPRTGAPDAHTLDPDGLLGSWFFSGSFSSL